MNIAILLLGVLAATLLLFGGCAAACVGLAAQDLDEAFDLDLDSSSEGSTTDEVIGAGLLAVINGILLYIGAGLAFAARRTSTCFIIVGLFLVSVGIVIDTWSAFAAAYYLALVLTIAATVISIIAWKQDADARKRLMATSGDNNIPTMVETDLLTSNHPDQKVLFPYRRFDFMWK